MHIIVPDASARPYQLIGLNYQWQPVHEQRFATLEELAKAVYEAASIVESNQRKWLPLERDVVRQKAVNPRGKVLVIAELAAWARRLRIASYRRRAEEFIFRRGSVPGVCNRNRGPSQRNRRVQNERRSTALVVWEDGEVAARAVRHDSHLPNSWDDYRDRGHQRNWKAQHTGRKSWDRPARQGKA